MNGGPDRLNRYVVASTILHIGLFVTVVFAPSIFPMSGDVRWGSSTGGVGGINATLVDSVSGIPLPTPPVVQEDAVANESPGLNRSEPAPPAPPPPEAEPVPETKASVKTTPAPRPAKTATATKTKAPEQPETPANAVPYGQGGRPDLAYGQFSTGAGQAGVNFGDGTFGQRYGWYVEAMTRRISQNWLRSIIDDRIRSAPRVYLSFEIERDGTVSNVEIKQSSGIPSLDRSAHRAILASSPLQALPNDYRGSSVTVSFYFEYIR
ncbi:MAG: TonB C-terminal domain-containing protein [Acidobacteria bacterium]|nr:TonB C-terminal domain-containing protein [Acidobacteriota bacterium]